MARRPRHTRPPVTDTSVIPAPPAGMLWGFDADGGNNPGAMTVDWFTQMYAAGYRVFGTTGHTNWSGVEHGWTGCQALLQNALDAGFYVYLYGRSVEFYSDALDSAGPLASQLCMFQLDVEDKGHPLTRAIIDGAKAKIAAINPNMRLTAYSGKGMMGNMGMDTSDPQFSDVPLHEYAGEVTGWPGSMATAPINQFAGWNQPGTMRVGWQLRMANPVTRFGVSVDEDAFDEAFLLAGMV